jgi:hypothetical protein
MHKKFANKDFVAVTVALDERKDSDDVAEKHKRIMDFLNRNNATMPNYWLEDPPSVWQDKLGVTAPPIAYVFDKDNKFVKKLYDSEYNTTVVENLVEELLKK